ncbi:hypothetical protein R6Q57_011530 [Mikania cordata]
MSWLLGLLGVIWPRNRATCYLVCRPHEEAEGDDRRMVQGRGCGFVAWADPPMCPRSIEVIHGLLSRCNKYEEIAKSREKENLKLKVLLGCSWFLFVMYLSFI